MSPSDGFNKPDIKSNNVLFPEPVSPTKPTLEPLGISISFYII